MLQRIIQVGVGAAVVGCGAFVLDDVLLYTEVLERRLLLTRHDVLAAAEVPTVCWLSVGL